MKNSQKTMKDSRGKERAFVNSNRVKAKSPESSLETLYRGLRPSSPYPKPSPKGVESLPLAAGGTQLAG